MIWFCLSLSVLNLCLLIRMFLVLDRVECRIDVLEDEVVELKAITGVL